MRTRPVRHSSAAARRRAPLVGALVLAGAGMLATCGPAAAGPVTPRAAAAHWVASWAASPTDASAPVDASLTPVPHTLDDQTARMVVTPHLAGRVLRVHLSNRFGSAPLTFGHVTVGRATAHGVEDLTPVTFGGSESVVAQPGADVTSDPVRFSFAAFTPLAVSIFVPHDAGPPTKHWNANATSRYAPAGSGDRSDDTGDTAFSDRTAAWFYVDEVDVRAPRSVHCVVAFGDSITDGFVGSSTHSIPVSPAVADRNGRYPDDLQRRLDASHMRVSVVNAGIGENMVLRDSVVGFGGPSALHRFRTDALELPGCNGVLVQEGINDLGLAGATAPQLIRGYQGLIAMAHAAGKKVWLGTLLPAANATVDVTPHSGGYLQRVNRWIRSQHLADGVVDFNRAIRDPSNPEVMTPAYAGPDNLHPDLAGYRVMARAVPLSMLWR
jgi:lysophospholipase L1-like esterase